MTDIAEIRARHAEADAFESDGLEAAEWWGYLTMLATHAHADRAVLLARVAELEAALTQPAAVEDGELRRLMAEATPGPWTHASDKLAAGNIKAPDNAALIVAAVNALPRLMAERERLREALEPSDETKAGYMGEVKNENGSLVSWTTIKEIMAMILTRAALGEKP